MSASSDIEWTDATWNPTRGCRKVSPGCKNCYAETFAERFRGVAGHPYELGFDPRLAPEQLGLPLEWRRPRRVFVNSMSDLFMEEVPDAYVAAVFGVVAMCQRHTFQVLTKRADRMRAWAESMTRTNTIGGRGPFETVATSDEISVGLSECSRCGLIAAEWGHRDTPESPARMLHAVGFDLDSLAEVGSAPPCIPFQLSRGPHPGLEAA